MANKQSGDNKWGAAHAGTVPKTKKRRRDAVQRKLSPRIVQRELERLWSRFESADPKEVVVRLTKRLKEGGDWEKASILGDLFPEALLVDLDELLDALDDDAEDDMLFSHGSTKRGHKGSPWSCLPDDVARNIFARLYEKPSYQVQPRAATARLVCRAWKLDVSAACTEMCVRRREPGGKMLNTNLLDVFPNVERLDLSIENLCFGRVGASVKSLRMACDMVHEGMLSRCTGLTELDLDGAETADIQSDDFYRCLAKLPNLRTLKLPKKQCLLFMQGGRIDDTSAQGMSVVGPRLRHFFCRDAFHLTDGGLEHFQFGPATLTNLTLDKYVKFGPAALAALQTLTSLQELSLNHALLTAECVQTVARSLPSLTWLSLDYCKELGDSAADALLPLKGTLRRLHIGAWEHISKHGVRSIGALESVTDLDLSGVSTVDGEGLAGLEPLAGCLETLSLMDTSVTHQDLVHLRNFTALSSINILNCANADDAVRALAPVCGPRLKYLWCGMCSGEEVEGFTDEGAAALQSMSVLQEVYLRGIKSLTGPGAASLFKMTELRRLNLMGTGVDGSGLAQLLRGRTLRQLWELKLADCDGLDAEILTALGLCLPALRVLNLSHCKGLGDAGLEALASVSSTLQTLHLKRCENITDAGVASLAVLTSLEDIDLRLCGKITAKGVAALQGLPRLRRILLHGTSVVVYAAPLVQASRHFCSCLDKDSKHFKAWWKPDYRLKLMGVEEDMDNYSSSDYYSEMEELAELWESESDEEED